MSAVPRRAAFDDLRVGQLVAVEGANSRGRVIGGTIRCIGSDDFTIPDYWNPGESDMLILGRAVERGEVTILRDPPAPFVTVRRADIEALEQWIDLADGEKPEHLRPFSQAEIFTHLRHGVRTLIDNADLRDT